MPKVASINVFTFLFYSSGQNITEKNATGSDVFRDKSDNITPHVRTFL